MRKPENDRRPEGREDRLVRWVVPAAFLAILALNTAAEWNAHFWEVSGDLQRIFSIVASREYPDAFANDDTFSDPQRFQFYTPTFIWLVQGFYRLTTDWSLFASFFSPLLLALHMVGFYLLGRELLRNKWAALGFTLLSLCYVWMPRRTYLGWVGHRHVEPRVFFLSLVPFVFYAALRLRERRYGPTVAMVLMGLLMYVHPVSAPVAALGLWFGLLALQPKDWTPSRRAARALSNGAVFLLVALPFVVWYKANVELGKPPPGDMGYDEALSVAQAAVPDLFDAGLTVRQTLETWTRPPLVFLLLLGLAGAVLGYRKKKTRRIVTFCVLWMLGVAAASFGVPILDQAVSRWRDVLPNQVSLARGGRYLAHPMMALAMVLPVRAAGLKHPARQTAWVLSAGLVACFLIGWPPLSVGLLAEDAWTKRRFPPPESRQLAALRSMCDYLRDKTPVGSCLIGNTSSPAMTARYLALRPAAHSWRDGAVLFYVDIRAMANWARRQDKWAGLCQGAAAGGDLSPLVPAARDMRADYLIIQKSEAPMALRLAPGCAIAYENDWWALIALRERPRARQEGDMP